MRLTQFSIKTLADLAFLNKYHKTFKISSMYILNIKYEITEHLEQYEGRYRWKDEFAWQGGLTCIRFQSPPLRHVFWLISSWPLPKRRWQPAVWVSVTIHDKSFETPNFGDLHDWLSSDTTTHPPSIKITLQRELICYCIDSKSLIFKRCCGCFSIHDLLKLLKLPTRDSINMKTAVMKSLYFFWPEPCDSPMKSLYFLKLYSHRKFKKKTLTCVKAKNPEKVTATSDSIGTCLLMFICMNSQFLTAGFICKSLVKISSMWLHGEI